MNYYIFRIDYSKRDYFIKNLEKGILRQGWGVENLSLLNENKEVRNQVGKLLMKLENILEIKILI